jgi:hypothetical protein
LTAAPANDPTPDILSFALSHSPYQHCAAEVVDGSEDLLPRSIIRLGLSSTLLVLALEVLALLLRLALGLLASAMECRSMQPSSVKCTLERICLARTWFLPKDICKISNQMIKINIITKFNFAFVFS